MKFVVDASAMIAYLRDERGGEILELLLSGPGDAFVAHAVNSCEVYYDFYRSGGIEAAFRALRDLNTSGVEERTDMEQHFWQSAATLKAVQRRVSLANCFAITLANNLGAELVTTDHHELDSIAAQNLCRIRSSADLHRRMQLLNLRLPQIPLRNHLRAQIYPLRRRLSIQLLRHRFHRLIPDLKRILGQHCIEDLDSPAVTVSLGGTRPRLSQGLRVQRF